MKGGIIMFKDDKDNYYGHDPFYRNLDDDSNDSVITDSIIGLLALVLIPIVFLITGVFVLVMGITAGIKHFVEDF